MPIADLPVAGPREIGPRTDPIRDDHARALVRAWTTARPVPGLPTDLLLHQGEDAIDLWERTEGATRAPVDPPFWAFAWAGGVGLTLHLIAHPELVRGRTVLDVAAGSGLIAVAAARLGALAVDAVDVDPLAVAACGQNAAANAVSVTARLADILDGDALMGDGARPDVVLAGDVFYERAFAARCAAFLHRAAAVGVTVLIGDPGRAHVPVVGLEPVALYRVPVPVQLEDGTSKTVTILRPAPEHPAVGGGATGLRHGTGPR